MSVVTAQKSSMHWGMTLATLFAFAGIPLCAETPLFAETLADEAAVWRETFDGPSPSWEAADHDTAYRVERHARTAEGAHSGQCEWLQITAGATGTHILFVQRVGRARVLPELRPSVWIRSDRAGARLLARAVLPRVADPQSGRPLTVLLSGGTYSQVGRWEEISVDNLRLLLSRQVRVLRSKLGSQVDDREAYIDQVLLNVHTGKGTGSFWIDDLRMDGHVAVPLDQALGDPAAVGGVQAASFDRSDPASRSPNPDPKHVQLHGSVMTVAGHTLFPRIVEHRGEPFDRLKSMGFNAVHLSVPATTTHLDEADRTGLWCVCPPPDVRDGRVIGARYRPVMCWDLGWELSRHDLTATRQLTTDLRRADRFGSRPLICSPQSDLRSYSRYANVLLLDRAPLGTSVELTSFAAWLESQPLLARPGTPLWATIQTEPSESIVRQLTAFDGGRRPTLGLQVEQLRSLAYTAVASGARGLVFTSRNRLDSPEPVHEMRAEALELVNLELSLIEPWASAGERLGEATASDRSIRVAVLSTERARLLMAIRDATGSQYLAPPGAVGEVSFVVPGVPESHTAYHLTTTGFRPLRHLRVAGGMRVTLPEFSLTGLIVFTQDPLVVNDLARRVAATAARAARLSHSLTRRRLTLVQNIQSAQSQRGKFVTAPAEDWLPQAQSHLRHCEQLLARQDAEGAQRSAEQSLAALRHVQRYHWEQAPPGLASPVTNPFRTNFAALPSSWLFADRVKFASRGPNLLVAGNFESLDQMVQAGWQHRSHHEHTVFTDVELSAVDPQSEELALRMRALPARPDAAPHVIETPPVWVVSAPVSVRRGQIVEIHGWVKVPRKIYGSEDGLLIMDSLAGRPLAARIHVSPTWSEFVLYRAADQDGPLTVTFALSGMGEAFLDDVTIQPLETPVHQARPPYEYAPPR